MSYLLADVPSMFDMTNTVLALLGVAAAVMALIQSSRSNASAKESNEISRAANELAKKALEMQEDESRVRLVVKPSMICLISDDEEGENQCPRPMVEIINLSAFPVTITKICWKTNEAKKWFYWKNPTLAIPFAQLPARIPPREALTAVGTPGNLSIENLRTVTAAVAFTACGEKIEGMTREWGEEVTRMAKQANTTGCASNTGEDEAHASLVE